MNNEKYAAVQVLKFSARGMEQALNAYPGKIDIRIEKTTDDSGQPWYKVLIDEKTTERIFP